MENVKGIKPAASPSSPKKSDPAKVILTILVILLSGAVGYLGYNSLEQHKELQEKAQSIDTLSYKVGEKVKELTDLHAQLEALKQKNIELGQSTDSLETVINDLNNDILKLKKDKAYYYSLSRKYVNSEADLKAANQKLNTLDSLNKRLLADRDSLNKLNKDQEDTLNNLRTINKEFAEKVNLASKLHAENIKIAVVNRKGKEEKIVPIYKLKSLAKLKISFTIADNPIAKHEDKDIFFRIVEPSGSTIFEGDKTFTIEGKESFYTDKQTLNFNNSQQQVTFVYDKGSAYKAGKYNVELFADGHKIGDSSITLK